jgi:hypothetical protein
VREGPFQRGFQALARVKRRTETHRSEAKPMHEPMHLEACNRFVAHAY